MNSFYCVVTNDKGIYDGILLYVTGNKRPYDFARDWGNALHNLKQEHPNLWDFQTVCARTEESGWKITLLEPAEHTEVIF